MRLDGGFRDVELIGDLLVEQALAQHHQDADLLRGERGDAAGDLLGLLVGGCPLRS